MKKLTSAAVVLFCIFSADSPAANIYTTLGGYYSKVDKPVDRSGSGGQFGIGYQLSNNWSVEIGYEQFIDQQPQWPNFGSNNSIMFKSGIKSAGVSASILGKTAINDQSTLFYRIGAMNNKSSSWVSYFGKTVCSNSTTDILLTTFNADNVQFAEVLSCGSSKTNTALLLGLGIDHQFSQQWFSRFEIVGLADPDAEALYALKLAVGYHF